MIISLAQLGEIHWLPALPDAWNKGAVKGLKARGNFKVGIEWNNHQLTSVVISSGAGGICTTRTAIPVHINGVTAQSFAGANGYTVSFNTVKGKKYIIGAKGK